MIKIEIFKKYIFILITLIFFGGCHTSYKSKAKLYRKQAQNCRCRGYSHVSSYFESLEKLKVNVSLSVFDKTSNFYL